MLKLYRADKKGNITFSEKCLTDGLYSKQLGSRDLVPHEKYGFWEMILNHIKADNELGRYLYNTTPYLSFTTDPKVAAS